MFVSSLWWVFARPQASVVSLCVSGTVIHSCVLRQQTRQLNMQHVFPVVFADGEPFPDGFQVVYRAAIPVYLPKPLWTLPSLLSKPSSPVATEAEARDCAG